MRARIKVPRSLFRADLIFVDDLVVQMCNPKEEKYREQNEERERDTDRHTAEKEERETRMD